MAKMIDRDPIPMMRFSEQIQEYSDNMKRVCTTLKSNMDSARPFMKDEASQRAFQKIELFADNLINSLPEAQRAGEKLSKSAQHLNSALSIQI
jgi:hypothetical protein